MSSASRRGHVLIVEDDRDIRESLAEILEEEGYGVLLAGDGLEALEVLEEASPKPNLILLDLMMPRMSGYQFREEQLRSEHAETPVALITADANPKDKARELRAIGVIRKPLKIEALLDLVSGAMNDLR